MEKFHPIAGSNERIRRFRTPIGEGWQNLCSIGIDIEIPTSEDLADMGRVLPDFDIEGYLNGMGDAK